MKTFGIIMSVITGLAAIAGIIFAVVKYGDQIVAWFKKTFGCLFGCSEEVEVILEDAAVEESPVEEVPVEENVAAEGDFEG